MAPSSDLPPGCRFNPDDAELISAYLRPMIARERLPEPAARFLHSADVYAADPATLVAGFLPAVLVSPTGEERRYWYFFGSAKARSGRDKRRSRVVGGGKGKWHSEKGRKVVSDDEGRNIGGYKQDFTYKPTNADGSEAEVWLMVEFGVHQQGEDQTGKSIPTLCKIYQSPRKPKSSTPISSTSSTQMRKRKKARDTPLTASSPVRRRLLVSPAAPIPPPPVQPQPDLNNYLDGVSWDQLLQDLMSGLTPDQVLGDLLMPVPESNVNCSFYMADHAGSASAVSTYADHAGSAISSYCGARTPFPDISDQVLLGDLLMPVPESEVNYSFSMSDHASSTVSTYDNTVLHGGSVTPFSENSDQADFFMPVFEPQQPVVESQGQSTMLNCTFLPCVPNAGISGSSTGGDTTDDEATSISCWAHALGILCRLIINEDCRQTVDYSSFQALIN